jgi:hypothetical protein
MAKKNKLTPSQLQLEKDVKRINERINEIAKAFGTQSYAYNEWYSTLKLSIPEKYRTTSKHGIIQIARSKEFYQSSLRKKTKMGIKRLLGMKTKGQLMKEAKESLKSEGNIKPTKVEIEDRAKIIDEINKFVSENEDMFYQPKSSVVYNIIHITGRKKTYVELKQIIDEYRKRLKESGGLFSDPFEGL